MRLLIAIVITSCSLLLSCRKDHKGDVVAGCVHKMDIWPDSIFQKGSGEWMQYHWDADQDGNTDFIIDYGPDQISLSDCNFGGSFAPWANIQCVDSSCYLLMANSQDSLFSYKIDEGGDDSVTYTRCTAPIGLAYTSWLPERIFAAQPGFQIDASGNWQHKDNIEFYRGANWSCYKDYMADCINLPAHTTNYICVKKVYADKVRYGWIEISGSAHVERFAFSR